MKRTKLLLSMLVGLLLAFVMVFAVACEGKGGASEGTPNVRPAPPVSEKQPGDVGITPGDDTQTLSLLGISIGTEGDTDFRKGDEFTTGALVIVATYLDSEIEPDPLNPNANLKVEEVLSTDENLIIDSSDYNNQRVGKYTIYVSYKYIDTTCTVSYNVTVSPVEPAYGGIVVELAPGKDNSFTLDASSNSVLIPDDIVVVYAINSNGEKDSSPLPSSDYTVKLYLGSTPVTGNTATANGVYSLVVTLISNPAAQDFITVYVGNTATEAL